jgi:hypothetical protein
MAAIADCLVGQEENGRALAIIPPINREGLMRCVVTACSVVLVWAGVQAQPLQLPDVLAKAAQYVASLETSLATVVVDEEYVQTAEVSKSTGGSSLGVGGGVNNAMIEGHTTKAKRTSRSEVLLVRRPEAPLIWSGVRSTLDIDGTPSEGEAGTLGRLAADPAALGREWNALREVSRRVSIGPFPRDLHAAWTSIALLRADQQPRVQFKKDGEEKIGGAVVWKVAFAEEKTPSLLKTTGNVQVPAHGTLWIDPQDGRVVRTKLELGTGLSMEQTRIEVDYAQDAALGTLVPVSMRERYDTTAGKVDCKTTFKNYRRIAAR